MDGEGESDDSGDEGSDSRLSKAERRERFKLFMKFLADNSDVEVVPHKLVQGSGAIHLTSEQREEIPEGFSFTTTASLTDMFHVWWKEMIAKDGDLGVFGVKLKSMFRSSLVRESLKCYESADDKLTLEPPANPVAGFGWLPTPSKKMEMEERDVLFLERGCRATCRALNLAEIILQAWDPEKTDLKVAQRMRKSISKAVKAMMQIQVASTCGLLQLRRDHFLFGVRGLTPNHVQRLRHAPVLSEDKLFPVDLLKELDEINLKSLHTRPSSLGAGRLQHDCTGAVPRASKFLQIEQPVQHLPSGSAQKPVLQVCTTHAQLFSSSC